MRGYSETTLAVLREMEASPEFPGTTLAPTLGFLFWWTLLNRPAKILQLGTLIGYSAIVLADAAKEHGGHVYTVDPDTRKLVLAWQYVNKAGFIFGVTPIDGRSTDSDVANRLRNIGPFDLIYLDTTHFYPDTVEELRLYTLPSLLSASGLLVLHDTSVLAQSWDKTGKGGVRKALKEWEEGEAAHLGFRVTWFDPPFYADTSGMALVYRDTSMTMEGQNG